jgi:hypothetical protein
VTGAWDEAAWERLAAELDGWPAGEATLWWRDDDAGPAGPALDRLLGVAAVHAVPLGLAVVPAWLDERAAAAVRAAPAAVQVLQHGYAHVNHEPAPPAGSRARKAELGASRPVRVALAELARGRRCLAAAVAERARPVLVPPWNRIAPAVRDALPDAGYRALSTFGPRPAAATAPGLRLVNCHVDPIRWRAGRGFAGAAEALDALTAHLAARRARAVDPEESTGLLSHHQVFSPEAWAFLDALLGRLRAHPAVRFRPVDALLEGAP